MNWPMLTTDLLLDAVEDDEDTEPEAVEPDILDLLELEDLELLDLRLAEEQEAAVKG